MENIFYDVKNVEHREHFRIIHFMECSYQQKKCFFFYEPLYIFYVECNMMNSTDN